MIVVRSIVFVLHLLVLSFLFGVRLNAYFSPQWFLGLNLLSLGFPVLLILHFLFSVFWLISFRKRGLIFLLAWVFLMPMIQRWVNYSVPKNQSSDFKMLSYNTKGVSSEKQSFLNHQNVDIIMLQEAGWEIQDKMKMLKFKYEAHSKITSIYSKYPILHQQKIPLIENAYAVFADIRIKGKIIRFFNVYLEPFKLEKTMVKPSTDLDVNEMKAKSLIHRMTPVFKIHSLQIEELKKHIDNSPYPVVLAGDFNAVPNSYEYYQLSQGLVDAFVEVGRGSATSFHDYKIPIRIDYIFSSSAILPVSYKVDRTISLSDHYPVYSEFSLKN